MSYDFIEANDSTESEEAADAENQPFEVRKWSLGDHTMGTTVDPEDLYEDAERNEGVDDELAGVLSEAAEMVGRSSVSDFECPVCGLNHGHSDKKHDIRSAFNVEPDFADEMLMCPYCHCGVNELAMLVDYFHFITEPMFSDQNEFEGVLELDYDDVRAVINATNEVTYEEAREAGLNITGADSLHLGFEGAIKWVANEQGVKPGTLVPDDTREDFRKFYRRLTDIKNAANNAPIPHEARTDIKEAREDIEEAING